MTKKRQTIKITSFSMGINETIQREEFSTQEEISKNNLKDETLSDGTTIAAIDDGNLNTKNSTLRRSTIALSSQLQISKSDYDDMKQYDDIAPHIYTVIEGRKTSYFVTGEASQRLGAKPVLGNQRYVPGIFDIHCAISLYNTIDADKSNVHLLMAYPPKDKFYKHTLHEMMKDRKFKVVYNGHEKETNIISTNSTSEAQAAFIDTTVDMSGLRYKGDPAIRKGTTLLIDVGGYTTDLQLFENGLPVKDTDISETTGIIHILTKLDEYLRQKYLKELQSLGIQQIMRHQLIGALTKGFLKIGQSEKMDCSQKSKDLIKSLIGLIEVNTLQSAKGTIKSMDNILLVNGGSYVILEQFKEQTKHPNLFINANDPKLMVLGTSHGLLKKGKIMYQEGKLK